MRRSLSSILALSLASAATTVLAQDTDYVPDGRLPKVSDTGQKGTISIDAATTPGRHFGMGFYVTNHLSIRPTIGIGYSDFSGVMVNVGTDLRYDFSPDRDWSLYAMTSVFYESGQDAVYASRPGYAPGSPGYSATSYDGLYYGAGLGMRRRITDRFAVTIDGRYLHTANTVSGSSFGQYNIDGQNSVVAALGVSFYLK